MQEPTRPPTMQYGSPMNNAVPPLILNTQPQCRVSEKYKVKSVKILSIIQIVLGCSAVILEIWDIINESNELVVGAGIWTGILFVTAGILGVLSSNTRKTCAVVAFLIMSTIASVFTIALLVISANKIHISGGELFNIRWERAHFYEDDPTVGPRPYHLTDSYLEGFLQKHDLVCGISGSLIFISFMEGIMAIVSSCYACRGLRCCTPQQGTVLIQGQVQCISGPNGETRMVIVPMPNQANGRAADPPPYQLTTPLNGFHSRCQTAPQEGLPAGHGMPLDNPQLHQAQAAVPSQPPTYPGRMTPPPEYEEEEKQLQKERVHNMHS